MKHYEKYTVLISDRFEPVDFPFVNDEVRSISKGIDGMPSFFKSEIIVSFLKDHSLQNNWIAANPRLTRLVSSGSLFTGSIESLFESCSNNPPFRQGLENYLTAAFAKEDAR